MRHAVALLLLVDFPFITPQKLGRRRRRRSSRSRRRRRRRRRGGGGGGGAAVVIEVRVEIGAVAVVVDVVAASICCS